MWYEFNINKNLDLGIIFDVSLLSKKGNLCNTHFTSYNTFLKKYIPFLWMHDWKNLIGLKHNLIIKPYLKIYNIYNIFLLNIYIYIFTD